MRDDKGKFATGNSGKPKGAKNKISPNMKVKLEDWLSSNFEDFANRMKKLDDKDFCRLYVGTIEYIVPKQQRSEMTLNVDELTDAQVDALLHRALGIAEQTGETDLENEDDELGNEQENDFEDF